jgi:hypothetical protein
VIIKPLSDILNNTTNQSTDLELLRNVLTMMENGGMSPLIAYIVLTVLSILFGLLTLKSPGALKQQLIRLLSLILPHALSLFQKLRQPRG